MLAQEMVLQLELQKHGKIRFWIETFAMRQVFDFNQKSFNASPFESRSLRRVRF